MAISDNPNIINPEQAHSLHGLFAARVERQADDMAFRHFDRGSETWKDMSWAETADGVAARQAGLQADGLSAGDKIALMLPNGVEWVMFEQAALGLGMVVVPLYINDRADNVAYILQDASVKLLVVYDQQQLDELEPIHSQLSGLVRVVSITDSRSGNISRLSHIRDWIPEGDHRLQSATVEPDALATIVYTSGTTGRPKGVMLSHRNILSNAWSAVNLVTVYDRDLFLSFLPLSHMLERTAGYYLPMIAGASVAFARSIPQLAEDLQTIKPTILISVPRIYERVYGRIQDQMEAKSNLARKLFTTAVSIGWQSFNYRQGRGSWSLKLLLNPLFHALVGRKIMAKLGGRLRVAVCGGAPIPATIAETFVGLGVNLLQGYGLTEASPVIACNSTDDNIPSSIGGALLDVEVRIDESNGELLCRGPNVMLGYWNNQEATDQAIDPDGWLHSGDIASERDGHYFITGRLKEIIVLSNGEKAPPTDMEGAIALDPWIDQVLVVGEGRPYLSALIVLNHDKWPRLAARLGLDPADPAALSHGELHKLMAIHIAHTLRDFPGYAKIHRTFITLEPWTVENGLLTASLKQRRERIIAHYQTQVDALYAGH